MPRSKTIRNAESDASEPIPIRPTTAVRKPKASHGDGSIRQRGKNFEARIVIDGRSLSETLSSKREAREWIAEQQRRAQLDMDPAGETITVAELIDDFLEHCERMHVRKTTMVSYVWCARWINEGLGKRSLTKLCAKQIQDSLDDLQNGRVKITRADGSCSATKLSAKSVRNVHGVLRAALNQARKWRYVQQNEAEFVDLPKRKKEALSVWSPETMNAFLEVVKGERFEPLYWVILTCGLRSGELCGLKWQDIHVEEREEDGERVLSGYLVVRRKVYRLPKYVGGGIDYGEPKSEKGRRTIGLIPETIEQLHAWQRQQEEERRLAGPEWKDGGWVFTWRNGGHLEGRHIDRAFAAALRKHGFEHIRVHDLRHSAVTTLLNSGENLKAVQEFAGHASISTTVDLYGHYIKGTEQQTARTMRTALTQAREKGGRPAR